MELITLKKKQEESELGRKGVFSVRSRCFIYRKKKYDFYLTSLQSEI